MKDPKIIAYIPADGYVEGQGWRVSHVVEGEDGHRPTGTWPYHGKPGEQIPWFWGHDYNAACAVARDYNQRLGIDEDTATKIVTESMAKGAAREEAMRTTQGKCKGCQVAFYWTGLPLLRDAACPRCKARLSRTTRGLRSMPWRSLHGVK